ncbi:MAG: flagellar hook assembly protein FlgD [Acidobacteriaceae bacterium]
MNIQGFTPSAAEPLMAQTSSSPRSAGAANTGSSSSTSNDSLGTSPTSLQDTFLNLLVTELQNQDPTAPVDPTEMVGQMVSLNQLDQLMSINQTLDNMAGTSGTSSAATQSSNGNAMVALNAVSPAAGSTSAATTASPLLMGATALSQQQPVYTPTTDPNALMNLYGSLGTPAATLNSTLTGGR